MAETLCWSDATLLKTVERRSGTAVGTCLQCHKCSAGCPIGPDTDYQCSQVIRLVQLGQTQELLQARALWLCASCETCSTRCPMGIDVAKVMDVLRVMAVERGATGSQARGAAFNRSFLGSVRRHGRVYELGMLAAYKLRCGDVWSDAGKFPRMLAKGKISLLPRRSGDIKRVRQVFRRIQEEPEQQ